MFNDWWERLGENLSLWEQNVNSDCLLFSTLIGDQICVLFLPTRTIQCCSSLSVYWLHICVPLDGDHMSCLDVQSGMGVVTKSWEGCKFWDTSLVMYL